MCKKGPGSWPSTYDDRGIRGVHSIRLCDGFFDATDEIGNSCGKMGNRVFFGRVGRLMGHFLQFTDVSLTLEFRAVATC